MGWKTEAAATPTGKQGRYERAALAGRVRYKGSGTALQAMDMEGSGETEAESRASDRAKGLGESASCRSCPGVSVSIL